MDEALERRLYSYPPSSTAKDRRAQPNWAVVHCELRRPGVTLLLLREEYRAVHLDGYGYSRICGPRIFPSFAGPAHGMPREVPSIRSKSYEPRSSRSPGNTTRTSSSAGMAIVAQRRSEPINASLIRMRWPI